MSVNRQYIQASIKTADNLRTIAQSIMLQDLSRLSLPEIEGVVDAIARVVPAGNVPGMILNGLARLPGRRPPAETVKRDINLLFKGIEIALDKAVYGAFFAGPAAVIWGYQNLLKLAGKDLDSAFPEGIWQFYVDYALREDTARHANETHGFDTLLQQHQIHLNPVDRLTAWVMTAVHCLHRYNELLANEWRERVYTSILQSLTTGQPDAAYYARLYFNWEKQKPYGRGADADSSHDYTTYRRLLFDRFLAEAIGQLPSDLRQEWRRRIDLAEGSLVAYQAQMSILAYLQPGPYGEARVPIELSDACVGVICQEKYYLIPACEPGTVQPAQVATIRAHIAALMSPLRGQPSTELRYLAQIKRSALSDFHRSLNKNLGQALEKLRLAPILINGDQRPYHLTLSEIRQAERGIGDHALTLFDTGKTFVFDQSHIFFDGGWGAALAEIMTREALAWAVYLHRLPPPQPGLTAVKPLHFPFELTERRLIEQAPQVSPEVSAETEDVQLKPILTLRRLFKQRSDLLNLTVNDLLVLYRAIHATTYQPDARLVAELNNLAQNHHSEKAAKATLDIFQDTDIFSPAIVIPIDVTRHAPCDRLFPLVFEVPLHELDLLNLHRRTMQALEAYERGTGDRGAAYAEFDQLQRTYLAALTGLGNVLSKAKAIAIDGESASVGAIKLLAYMPVAIQRLLDKIPNRFDLLNDLLVVSPYKLV